jgi:transforming growth factor-beta-induced protein
MKNLSLYLAFSFFSLFIFSSCGDDDVIEMPQPTDNIVQIAQANGFTSLAAALTKAGLVDELQGNTDYTVFAPTNEAFSNLLAAVGQTSVDDVPASVLQQILLYHVVQGKVFSTDIAPGNVATLQGSEIALGTANGITVNGVSVVSPFDVEATNGVIHTIDEVLVPASVAQFVNTVLEPAYFNEAFSTLVSAAVKANVVETLLTTPNLTIFAPTNDAFEASGIDPTTIDSETLAAVLTYHVVGAKVMSTDIPRKAATVNGNEIFFSMISSGAFINGNTEITKVDIESGTGVVHVIDSVLLPPSGNIVETAISLSANGEFTSLIAALTRTATEGTADQNLINVLNSEGPFTVFAPTNAAFQAVLDSNMDWNTLSDIPLETLVAVLTYHVVPARAFDKDLGGAVDANSELPTAFGKNIVMDLTNFSINETTNIVDINYNTTNGVIHVIDSVLLP